MHFRSYYMLRLLGVGLRDRKPAARPERIFREVQHPELRAGVHDGGEQRRAGLVGDLVPGEHDVPEVHGLAHHVADELNLSRKADEMSSKSA